MLRRDRECHQARLVQHKQINKYIIPHNYMYRQKHMVILIDAEQEFDKLSKL